MAELRPRKTGKCPLSFAEQIKLRVSIAFYFYFYVSIHRIQIILTSGTIVKPGDRTYNLKCVKSLDERPVIEK